MIETDPVGIETDDETSKRFTTVDADAALLRDTDPLEEGDHVTAFGTLTDESTLEVERSLTREPWQVQYMYAVSFLGGLWVAGRFVQGWRFDRQRLEFVANADEPPTREKSPPSGTTLTDDEDHERETPPVGPPSGGDR